MKKILVTGAKGIIGSILVPKLKEFYNVTSADLPQYDLRNFETVSKLAVGKDAIIHLAWETKTDNFESGKINPDNSLMFENIYRTALRKKVPRVIMASSIHADNFQNNLLRKKPKMMKPYDTPLPTSPYGAHKIFLESLGKYYSTKGLEVACVRFGAVGYENPKRGDDEGSAVWLSNKDCLNLIRKILEVKNIANNFSIVYGVSNNKTRIHSNSNDLGWKPKDDSSKI